MATLTVTIDIKPGSTTNPINLGSNGKIPVALLSTDTFNAASQIDVSSLRFGHTGKEASLVSCAAPQDLNGDGLTDLLLLLRDAADELPTRRHGRPLDGTDNRRALRSKGPTG